jgi:cell division protein FtsI (penicillin-binding protein 3)
MLGRTDSRRRLLFLLAVFLVGSVALAARLAYWQVVDRDRLTAEALAQTSVTLDTPSKRGDIYDRTGTVVLATTIQRERLVAAPANLTVDQRKATVATLAGILGLDAAATADLRDKLSGGAKYLILRHGLD